MGWGLSTTLVAVFTFQDCIIYEYGSGGEQKAYKLVNAGHDQK